jgi:hypothetical protein
MSCAANCRPRIEEMRLLFSWSLLPPKQICWNARLYCRVTERVQQVRFLPRSRILRALCPIGQHLLEISFCALEGLYVCCDAVKRFLGELVNMATGSASSITGFQDFGKLCQSESDPKRSSHHQHSLHGARGVDAVTGVCSRSSWENANPFVVSHRVGTHTSRLGEGPGKLAVHSKYTVFRSSGS